MADRQSSMHARNLVAGGIAGAISRTVVAPLERVKILFQVQNSAAVANRVHFDSLRGTFRHIWKSEGLLGLFKGNGTNVLRIIPYSSVQFTSYELYLKTIQSSTGLPLGTAERLLSGAAAGITAATFAYPLDLARTRLSLPGISNRSVIACLKETFRKEGGFPALYSGLLPTLLGIAPLVAINFAVYEGLKIRYLLHRGAAEVPTTVKLACGGIAGAAAQTVTYPLDVLRRRLQSNNILAFGYDGVWDAICKIYTREGWRSFYRGLLPNYLKVVPAISVSFVIYEWAKSILK